MFFIFPHIFTSVNWLLECYYLFSVPANILSITPNSAYENGSRVKLNCSVEGDPPPYVAWINVTDGSVLQNRTVNTSYVIPSVSSHHKGTYRCVTGNRYGKDSKNITIIYVVGEYDANVFTVHVFSFLIIPINLLS